MGTMRPRAVVPMKIVLSLWERSMWCSFESVNLACSLGKNGSGHKGKYAVVYFALGFFYPEKNCHVPLGLVDPSMRKSSCSQCGPCDGATNFHDFGPTSLQPLNIFFKLRSTSCGLAPKLNHSFQPKIYFESNLSWKIGVYLMKFTPDPQELVNK